MTDEQTFATAELIVEMFPHLNIADINLIFKWAKAGKFGRIYDRLDGNVILEWFEKYFDDRCNAAAERSIREAESHKSRGADSPERTSRIVEQVLSGKKVW